MRPERSNLIAGLFVLIGITLAFVAIVILADIDRMLTPMQEVIVRFPLGDGLQGLKVGAEVTLGDAPAGTVTDIRDESAPQDPAVIVAKRVHFTVPERYKIFDNAQIELVVPPLGAGTKLNIRSVGHDAGQATEDELNNPRLGDSWTYQSGEVIRGGIAGSALTSNLVKDMGIEDLQRAQIRNIIANVDRVMESLAADPESIEQIVANVRDITASVKTDLPEITGRAKAAVAKADDAMGTVNEILGANRDRIENAIAQLDESLTTVRTLLDENKEKVTNTLTNVEQISIQAREQTLVKVNEALDKAQEAVDNVRTMSEDLKQILVTQRPVLEHAIANARITTDQLKLTAIEVRRSPWRLLYKPTTQELETDAIYDASRSFALAATALNSTAQSMQAMLDRYGDRIDPNDKNLKLMLDNLHQSFEQFTEAEQQFWHALQGDGRNEPKPR